MRNVFSSDVTTYRGPAVVLDLLYRLTSPRQGRSFCRQLAVSPSRSGFWHSWNLERAHVSAWPLASPLPPRPVACPGRIFTEGPTGDGRTPGLFPGCGR